MARLTSRAPLGAVQAFQYGQQVRGQLLEQASSMVPDNEAIVEVLSDFDVYTPDMNPVRSHVEGVVNDYMSKYRQNPFYAFTREGRTTVAELQRLRTNPYLNQMSQSKEAAEAEWERVKDYKNNVTVSGGGRRVNVLRDGKIQSVSIEDVRDNEAPLTIAREQSLVTGALGLSNYEGHIPNYETMDPVDVLNKIKAHVMVRGGKDISRESDDTSGMLTITNRSRDNVEELRSRVEELLSGGLTSKEMNTLVSEYMKSEGDWGEGSSKRAQDWIIDLVVGYARGEREVFSDVSSKVSAAFTAQSTSQKLNASLQYTGQAFVSLYGDQAPGGERRGNTDLFYFEPVSPIPVDRMLADTRDPRSVKGVNMDSYRVPDIPLYDATVFDKIYIEVQGPSTDREGNPLSTGDLYRLSNAANARQVMVVDKTYQPVFTRVPVDAMGNPLPVEIAAQLADKENNKIPFTDEEVQKYLTRTKDGRYVLKRQDMVKSRLMTGNERGIFGNNDIDSDELVRDAKEAGYSGTTDKRLKEYYEKHSFQGGLDNVIFFSDEIYKIMTYMPVTSFEAVNYAGGGDVFISKEDTALGNGIVDEPAPIANDLLPAKYQRDYSDYYNLDNTQ